MFDLHFSMSRSEQVFKKHVTMYIGCMHDRLLWSSVHMYRSLNRKQCLPVVRNTHAFIC